MGVPKAAAKASAGDAPALRHVHEDDPVFRALLAAMTAPPRRAFERVAPEWLADTMLEAISEHLQPGFEPNREFLIEMCRQMEAAYRRELAAIFVHAPRTAAELWQMAQTFSDVSARRRRGRRQQAAREKAPRINAFSMAVWPKIARFYRPGRAWRPHALRLCREHGISVSDRSLDRLISEARAAGVPIPHLRKRRPSGSATSQ